MIEDPDLRRLVRHAGAHDAPLDLDRVADRVATRRRRRHLARGVTAGAVVIAAVLAVQALLPVERGSVDLAGAPERVEAFDPDVDALPALPPVPVGQRSHLPTVLPAAYRRCAGPVEAGELLRTTFCARGEPDLVLDRGPHRALPEEGEVAVPVAARLGAVREGPAGRAVTVSDGNTDADVHLRLLTTADGPTTATLAAVLASIPAIADAPPPE